MPISPFISKLREKVGTDMLLAVGISAVVRNDAGQLLLVKPTGRDYWMPVGGMIEPGEQPADAAVRECLEETGVPIAVDRLAGVYDGPRVTYDNGDRMHYVTIVFRCRAVGDVAPRPLDGENADARYFPPDALPPLRDDYARYVAAGLSDDPAAAFARRKS